MARRVVMMMGAVATAMAIYPGTSPCKVVYGHIERHARHTLLLIFFQHVCLADDHWDFSHKLTVDNHKEFIQSEIDAGRTLFVRWIASSG